MWKRVTGQQYINKDFTLTELVLYNLLFYVFYVVNYGI